MALAGLLQPCGLGSPRWEAEQSQSRAQRPCEPGTAPGYRPTPHGYRPIACGQCPPWPRPPRTSHAPYLTNPALHLSNHAPHWLARGGRGQPWRLSGRSPPGAAAVVRGAERAPCALLHSRPRCSQPPPGSSPLPPPPSPASV